MPDELDPIRAVVDGLDFPSESDSPFDVCFWKSDVMSGHQVISDLAPGRTPTEVPMDQFFDDLAQTYDRKRFAMLRMVLESLLSNIQIFRVEGEDAAIDIYIIGKTESGRWAGVHTISVET